MSVNNALVEDCFGVLRREGQPTELVRRFTISNQKMSFQVITYGAAITSIKVPDREGVVDDVVLGYDDLPSYLSHPYYFGATIGRVANRISKASFKLQGREYYLERNCGRNHLHGGLKGFDKVLWDSHVEGKTVTFSYVSRPWEENYPGEVVCHVMYALTDDNEIVISYRATTSSLTPLNLTNHSYFNLSGHGAGLIHDHVISVDADMYTPVDECLIPTGAILPVNNTPYDFREPQTLDDILHKVPNANLDINMCINGECGEEKRAARLYDPRTGRVMDVTTTQPGLQLYAASGLPTDDSVRGKEGKYYRKYGALCLETQNYPDAVNHPHFPACLLSAGEVYKHTTVYSFSVDLFDEDRPAGNRERVAIAEGSDRIDDDAGFGDGQAEIQADYDEGCADVLIDYDDESAGVHQAGFLQAVYGVHADFGNVQVEYSDDIQVDFDDDNAGIRCSGYRADND